MDRIAGGNLGIEPPVLTEIYRQMTRIRAVDKAIQANAAAGKFRFPYWPMTGQEAIPAVLAKGPAMRLGADYAPIAYSGEIENHLLPNANSIAARVRQAFKTFA